MFTEQAVIGSMIVDADAAAYALDALTPKDFQGHVHSVIFEAMKGLNAKQQAIDLVTVSTALADAGMLETCGGMAYLVECAQSTPTTANIREHVQIVMNGSIRRGLIAGLQKIIVDAPTKEPEEITSDALMLIQGTDAQVQGDRDSLPEIVEEEYLALDGRANGGAKPLETGIEGLDKLTGGITQGEMWVIGARPSVGKSALSMQIAETVVEAGKRALFFSAEMSRAMIAQRYFAANGLPANKVRSGRMDDTDWDIAYNIVQHSRNLEHLHIDTVRCTIPQIRTRARSMQARGGLDLVIVDYLQIIQAEGRRETRNLEVASISADLKRMAKQLNVPVVVLSQLSRNSEQRTGAEARPKLSDLRDSGGTEQDADVVVMLYRLDTQTGAAEYGPLVDWLAESGNTLVRMEVSKNRNGPLGRTDMVLDGRRVRFVPPVMPMEERKDQEEAQP